MPMVPEPVKTEDLPLTVQKLDVGTEHVLAPGECACGTGPHAWISSHMRGGDPAVMKMTFFPLEGDPQIGQGWQGTVEMAIGRGKTFPVLQLISVQLEPPPGPYIPPPPAEAVNSITMKGHKITVVQWGCSEIVFGCGSFRWKPNTQELLVAEHESGWVSLYWRHGVFRGLTHQTKREAIEYLLDGSEADDLAPVGFIKIGAEAGVFWEDR